MSEEPSLQPGTVPLLRRMSPAGRAKLLRQAVVHSVPAGTILFRQGEVPTFQHVVLSGAAHLFGQSQDGHEVLIEAVSAPDMVIPAAVMTGLPYLMQARVPVPSHFLLIQADAFRAAAERDPALAREVIASLSGQFRRMVRQIKNLKLRSATERVGCYILALSQKQGTPERATLPYEKNLIASELGMTRESFSRALNALQQVGVAVEGEEIAIADRVRLIAASRPDPLIDGGEPEVRPTEGVSVA